MNAASVLPQPRPRRASTGLAGLVAVVGLIGSVSAALGQAPTVQPMIVVKTTPTALNFGSVPAGQPVYSPTATLTVQLYSNLTVGGLVATLSPLQRSGGGATITPSRVSIKRSDQATFTPMTNGVNLTGIRPPGVAQFVLQFQIDSATMDPAGEYEGTLTLTYGVAP